MKKSTLITTIAMVVVVVVALSTATYAWFTSSQATVADMSISTSSSSGWGLYLNSASIGTGEKQATPDSTAMVFNTSSGMSKLVGGLWCPTGTVTAELTSNTGVCDYTPGVAFFDAKQKDVSDFSQITIENAPEYYQSEVVRVTNNTPNEADGTFTITVSFPAQDDEGNGKTVLSSAVAARSLRFVMIGYNGSTSAVVAKTDYYYASSVAQSGASLASPNSMVGAGSYTAAYTKVDASGFTRSSDMANAENIVESDGSATTNAGGFTYTSTAVKNGETTVVAADSYYVTYTYTISAVAPGTGMNYAIYYWLDGAVLSTPAGAANLQLHFSIA